MRNNLKIYQLSQQLGYPTNLIPKGWGNLWKGINRLANSGMRRQFPLREHPSLVTPHSLKDAFRALLTVLLDPELDQADLYLSLCRIV